MGALEEDLDIPADPVNPNDVFYGKRKIRCQNREPFFLLAAMADEHHMNRNATSQFGANQPENLALVALHRRRNAIQCFERQAPALNPETFLVVLEHADHIESAGDDFANERSVREPAVHQDIGSGHSSFEDSIQHGCGDLWSWQKRFLTAFIAEDTFVDVLVDAVNGRLV